jgi:hypothetical protein
MSKLHDRLKEIPEQEQQIERPLGPKPAHYHELMTTLDSMPHIIMPRRLSEQAVTEDMSTFRTPSSEGLAAFNEDAPGITTEELLQRLENEKPLEGTVIDSDVDKYVVIGGSQPARVVDFEQLANRDDTAVAEAEVQTTVETQKKLARDMVNTAFNITKER